MLRYSILLIRRPMSSRGVIAEQLSSGSELASGEREVTVLFVDIRGYTGFSESRRATHSHSPVIHSAKKPPSVGDRHRVDRSPCRIAHGL